MTRNTSRPPRKRPILSSPNSKGKTGAFFTATGRGKRPYRAILETFSGQIDRAPASHCQMLIALDFALGPTKEIVIAGKKGGPEVKKMVRLINSYFIPGKVIVLHNPGKEGKAVGALPPYLKEMAPIDGKATAYVCENYRCRLPTTSLEKLKLILSTETNRNEGS